MLSFISKHMLSPSHLTSRFVLDICKPQIVHMTLKYIFVDGFRIFSVILSFLVFCFVVFVLRFYVFLSGFFALEKDPLMLVKRNVIPKVSDFKRLLPLMELFINHQLLFQSKLSCASLRLHPSELI